MFDNLSTTFWWGSMLLRATHGSMDRGHNCEARMVTTNRPINQTSPPPLLRGLFRFQSWFVWNPSERICLKRFTRFLGRECLLKETQTDWHSEDCFAPDIYRETDAFNSNWNMIECKKIWQIYWTPHEHMIGNSCDCDILFFHLIYFVYLSSSSHPQTLIFFIFRPNKSINGWLRSFLKIREVLSYFPL